MERFDTNSSLNCISPVNDADQLFKFLLPDSTLFITSIRVTTLQDGNLKALFKFLSCAYKNIRDA